jgi:hypothetical protein
MKNLVIEAKKKSYPGIKCMCAPKEVFTSSVRLKKFSLQKSTSVSKVLDIFG